MANLQSNPWSLTHADVAAGVISTITLNADGSVTVVLTGALTFNTALYTSEVGVVPPIWFTVFGVTNTLYNGFYHLFNGVSGGTTFILQPQFSIAAGTAASAGGTFAQCLYQAYVRVEDISWQNASAAGQLLDLRDRSGNIVWQATATGGGSQNRGKIFWINGLTPFEIDSGVVLLTID